MIARTLVLAVDAAGKVLRSVRLPLEGTFSPADVQVEEDGLVVAGGFRARNSATLEQDVLIFKVK